MNPQTKWLLAMLACMLPCGMHAEPVGYVAGFDWLYRMDFADGKAIPIGPFGNVLAGNNLVPIADVEGLAFSPAGDLYGVSDAQDLLLKINPRTGAATIIGPLNVDPQDRPYNNLDFGLAFTCNGSLWLSSDTTSKLWQVDPTSAQSHLVGDIGAKITGLAAKGNELYGIGVEENQTLYRINTSTGIATAVGALNLPDRFYDAGLDFDSQGQLWATIDYLIAPPPQPQIYRNDLAKIDPTTGRMTLLGAIKDIGQGINTVQMEGLAIANPVCNAPASGGGGATAVPVPSLQPSMLWLLAMLVFSASSWFLRKKG